MKLPPNHREPRMETVAQFVLAFVIWPALAGLAAGATYSSITARHEIADLKIELTEANIRNEILRAQQQVNNPEPYAK